jgi:hypothetical protein
MRLRRPRHGTVVAYVALFAALGGTSYAAATLPRNSVGSSQIRAGSVTSSKLANFSVTSAKVRNGSLTAADFAKGQLPQGPAGPQGAAGPAGPAGSGAVAFANVAQDGTVVASQSQGLGTSNIVHNVAGGYCIAGLAQAPRNVQLTPQYGFNGAITANAALGAAGQCAAGTQITVVLTSNVTGAAVNNGLFISID